MYYWILLILSFLVVLLIQIKKRQANQKAENLLIAEEDLSKIYFFFNEGKISSNQFSILSVDGQHPTIAQDLNGTFIVVPSGMVSISIKYQYLGLKSIRKQNKTIYEFTSTELFPVEKHSIYKMVLNPETERPALQLIA